MSMDTLKEKNDRSERILNIINSKFNDIKCDLFEKRKKTAEVFLKQNEKENIATKTKSIKWNYDFVKEVLDLRTVANSINNSNNNENNNTAPGKTKSKISKRDLRFVMLTNELWSKKYYQKVIEDSFLFPKVELFKGKEISKTYKNFLAENNDYYQSIKYNEAKKQGFIENFGNTILKYDNIFQEKTKSSPSFKETFFKNFKRSLTKENFSPKKNRQSLNLLKPERNEGESNLDDLLKKIEIVGQMKKDKLNQTKKQDFFQNLINSNKEREGNDYQSIDEINKTQIIKRKLLSTYQYSKHRRGKNPFRMLLSGANDSKKEKSETSVDKILIKNAIKKRNSTFHYMTPIKNLQAKKKTEKKRKENDSNEISTVLPNTDEKIDQDLEFNRKSGKPNSRSKSSMNFRKINDKQDNFEKTNFYKKVNSAIIQRCSGMIREGDNLKRQIEIGMHYKQIENMIDYAVKFKEAKILNEIHTYEKEREKSKMKDLNIQTLKNNLKIKF